MSAEIEHINIKGIDVPVIFEKNTNLPTFNLQLIFQNSGYIQDKKLSGLASLSAKLLNEGTKKLGSVKFAEKLEEKAISLSTHTGFETFVIEASSLKETKSDAIKLLNSLIKSPNYSEETLDKLKTLQIGALKRKENDFDYVAKTGLNQLLFKDTPLQNPASGTIKSLENIQLEDIETFIKKSLTLNNLIVVAGGDLTYDELIQEISKTLTLLKKGTKSKSKPFKVNHKAQTKVDKKETEQAYIYFGSPFDIQVDSKDTYIAKVASFILGGSGFGSRLMEEIRVKRGLAYSAYGYISINKTYSYFTGYLQTKNENTNKAKELVGEIVDTFVQNGVTQEELDAAKNFLMGSEPLRVETLSQRLNRSFTYFYRGLDQNHSKEELAKIEALTLDELNAFIKSHVEIEKISYFIVRN